jgi:hypothetical protein
MLLPRFLVMFLLAGVLPAATVGPVGRFLPLIHDGAGWSTQVTVINLSEKPATIVLSFLSPGGFAEEWPLRIRATNGTVSRNTVDAVLLPGAVSVVETSGTPERLTRGFVELYAVGDQPFGAFATLVQSDGGKVLRRMQVPLTAAHEKKSVVPLDLSDPAARAEIIWVTLTTTTTLDLEFRDQSGALVRREQVYMENRAQVFVDLLERFPELKDFRGTMHWFVSFPGADRYENRTMAGMALLLKDGQTTVSTGMTLAADQASTSPY